MIGEDTPERKVCLIQDALGRVEACPGEGCPFWEEGGAVAPGGCAVERLGLPTSVDLHRRPDLAAWLLEIRRALQAGGSPRAGSPSLFKLMRQSGS